MSAHLEEALNWIMEGENIKSFCSDFNVIFSQVNGRPEAGEIAVLEKVHAKCRAAGEAPSETLVRGERSYGWEEKR